MNNQNNNKQTEKKRVAPRVLAPGSAEHTAAVLLRSSPRPEGDALARYMDARWGGDAASESSCGFGFRGDSNESCEECGGPTHADVCFDCDPAYAHLAGNKHFVLSSK